MRRSPIRPCSLRFSPSTRTSPSPPTPFSSRAFTREGRLGYVGLDDQSRRGGVLLTGVDTSMLDPYAQRHISLELLDGRTIPAVLRTGIFVNTTRYVVVKPEGRVIIGRDIKFVCSGPNKLKLEPLSEGEVPPTPGSHLKTTFQDFSNATFPAGITDLRGVVVTNTNTMVLRMSHTGLDVRVNPFFFSLPAPPGPFLSFLFFTSTHPQTQALDKDDFKSVAQGYRFVVELQEDSCIDINASLFYKPQCGWRVQFYGLPSHVRLPSIVHLTQQEDRIVARECFEEDLHPVTNVAGGCKTGCGSGTRNNEFAAVMVRKDDEDYIPPASLRPRKSLVQPSAPPGSVDDPTLQPTTKRKKTSDSRPPPLTPLTREILEYLYTLMLR